MGYMGVFSCEQVVDLINGARQSESITMQELFEEFISNSNAKPSTLKEYSNRWNSMGKHFDVNMPVKAFSRYSILKIMEGLKKRKINDTSINSYLGVLSSIINYAKNCAMVEFKVNPFAGITKPKTKIRQSWLSVDEIKYISDIELKKNNLIWCRDLFMLSYYLGGINLTDLLDINFNDCHNTLSYVRHKTERLNPYAVSFSIPEEGMEIINRYKGENGHLNFGRSSIKSKILSNTPRNISILSKLTGIDNLIFYSARKSFSQHAFELGIQTPIIDYLLGHKIMHMRGGVSIYAYVKVTPEIATEALRKVLDNLK